MCNLLLLFNVFSFVACICVFFFLYSYAVCVIGLWLLCQHINNEEVGYYYRRHLYTEYLHLHS